MKYFSLFLCVFLIQTVHASLDKETVAKTQLLGITRLEGLRDECLLKNSGNQRLCRKNVLKQCRSSMQKRDCLVLMSKMSKTKLPKTDGPSPLQ